jgi:hypothetical protein
MHIDASEGRDPHEFTLLTLNLPPLVHNPAGSGALGASGGLMHIDASQGRDQHAAQEGRRSCRIRKGAQ